MYPTDRLRLIALAFFLVVIIVAGLSLSACQANRESHSIQGEIRAIRVMTFNTENLFDTSHDPGKNDYAYLPLAQKKTRSHQRFCEKIPREDWRRTCLYLDWSESLLEKKLNALAEVILSVQPNGPDVVILQEVENRRVLKRLQSRLSKGNYREAILLEGGDPRGIDVAILSRLKRIGEPKLHRVPPVRIDNQLHAIRRDILESTFELPDGTPLSILGVHFPAPHSPIKLREVSQLYLNSIREKMGSDRIVIAGGDFNYPSQKPAEMKILNQDATRVWLLSHQLGCNDCRGTVYWPPKKVWSFFDILMLSKNLGVEAQNPSSWVVQKDGIFIANQLPSQKTSEGTPRAFDYVSGTGVSDHWPVVVTLEPRSHP